MSVRFEDCTVLRATGKALLCHIPDGDADYWIPHAHVDDDSEVWKVGDRGDLVVSDWIAEEKGLT